MPSAQGYGAIPGGDQRLTAARALADLLEGGILGKEQYQKQQEDKKNSGDDIIRAGITSKTMRPSKDGEKSDFTDSQGRGWTYDDSDLKEVHRQADNQRKDAHWITINSNVEKEIQQAINSGQLDGTNQTAVNAFRNQRIASYLGVGADGKMSQEAKDDLSPEGQAWVDSLTKSGGDNKPTRQTVPGPQPSLMNSLLNIMPNMGAPQNNPGTSAPSMSQSFNPMSPNPGQALSSLWNAMNVPSNMPVTNAHGTASVPPGIPQSQGTPDMQALMSLISMRNQQQMGQGFNSQWNNALGAVGPQGQ